MRVKTVNNSIITYPEKVVWLYDSNQINISALDGHNFVGADITITYADGVHERRLRYMSEQPSVTFTLDDSLANLYDQNIGLWNVDISTYVNNHLDGHMSFAVQVLEGKSYTNRSHYISRTIYIYNEDELDKVQVASPTIGAATILDISLPLREGLNQYNLSSIINDYGTYTLCLGGSSSVYVQPTAIISGDEPVSPWAHRLFLTMDAGGSGDPSETKEGGDVWQSPKEIFPICHRIIYNDHCDDYHFIELRYRDADGCMRYIGGRILEETNTSESANYYRTDYTNVFRNIPRRHKTGGQRLIKVSIEDVARDAYLLDILQSEHVYFRNYDGIWWDCALATEKLVNNNEDFQDYVLEIIVNAE